MSRSSRMVSGGQPLVTGIRSRRPSRVNVPEYQRTGTRAPPPARVAGGLVAVLAAPGGGEPGVAVAAQHRPRPGGVQFAERAGAGGGQFPAQLPVPGQRRVLPAAAPGGEFQDAAPHVARRPQQPEHPVPLVPGQAQPAPRGAVDYPRRISVTLSRHGLIMTRHTDKTANTTPKASEPAGPRIRRTTGHRQRPSRSHPRTQLMSCCTSGSGSRRAGRRTTGGCRRAATACRLRRSRPG